MSLTEEDYKVLQRPFAPHEVQFRIDGGSAGKSVRVLTYIDARLAAERLSEVDPSWSGEPVFASTTDGIGLADGVPVVFHLEVKGVRRADVGQIGPVAWDDNGGAFKKGDFVADDKHVKQAVSDALKRSAVLYGVGSSLYALGQSWVDKASFTKEGKGKYLSAKGEAFLRDEYEKTISSPAFVKRFGKFDGSVAPVAKDAPTSFVDNNSVVSVVEEASTPSRRTTEEQTEVTTGEVGAGKPQSAASLEGSPDFQAVIAGIFKLIDRSPEAGLIWLDKRKNKRLAVKKTLQDARDKRQVETAVLDDLLVENGLSELVGSY